MVPRVRIDRPGTLPGLLVALACLAHPASGQEVTLPDGPGARAWAAVGPDTRPATLDTALLQALEEGPFSKATWRLWAAALGRVREAGLEKESAADRALLCLVARDQGRYLDAWSHYARLVADPTQAAALRHHLWPGVPLDIPALAGGRTPELPEEVELRPALPETSGTWEEEFAYSAAVYEQRMARVDGLVVDGSSIDLLLTVENSGIKLQGWLREGRPVTLHAWLPEPVGWRIGSEYIDWEKGEGRHASRPLVPPPGDEPWTIFGRVREQDTGRPAARVDSMPASLRLGGLVLEDEAARAGEPPAGSPPAESPAAGSPAAGPPLPEAELLEELLDLPVRILSPDEPRTSAFRPVELPVPAEREAREAMLRYLAGALEASLLQQG